MSLLPDLTTIEEHAAQDVETAAPEATVEERIGRLENALEFLTEEQGLENRFRQDLSSYVADLRAEAKLIRTLRITFGIITTVAAIGLLVSPVALAIAQYDWFVALPVYPKSALLVGMLAGGVVLLLALTKSVYRSAHERASDEFIPPQIKLIHELLNGTPK